MDDITATFTLRLTPEDLYALLARTLGRGEPIPPAIVTAIVGATPPPEPAAPTGLEGLGNLGQEPIDREQQAEIERKATGLTPPEPPPLPPKQPRGRASRVNGAAAGGEVNSTPIASPPVNRLDEASMRALLSKVGAVHPLKVKAITNILENRGGARRLSECDPATWPAIAEEAEKVLAEYAP